MVLVTVAIAIPCLLGRWVFLLLRVPPWLFHEPCSVALGTYLCIKLYNVLAGAVARGEGGQVTDILRAVRSAPVHVRKSGRSGMMILPCSLLVACSILLVTTCRYVSDKLMGDFFSIKSININGTANFS